MLIPQKIKLAGYRGASYLQQVNFWQDTAKTQPFDFTPWNVAVFAVPVGNQPALTLHHAESGGSIIFSLSPAETSAAGKSYHVYVQLTAKTGSPPEIEFLAKGPLSFTDP